MANEYTADEWMEANQRLLQVWTDINQRWMSNMVTGNPGSADKQVVFDDLYGLTGKLLPLIESFAGLIRESGHYQAFFTPVWFEIWQHFLRDSPGADQQLGSFEEAMNSWFNFADAELVKVQGSAEYLEVNQRIGQAITQFKTCQAKLNDYLLSCMGMPTLTELDNMSRTLFELKRAVRRLQEANKLPRAQAPILPKSRASKSS